MVEDSDSFVRTGWKNVRSEQKNNQLNIPVFPSFKHFYLTLNASGIHVLTGTPRICVKALMSFQEKYKVLSMHG